MEMDFDSEFDEAQYGDSGAGKYVIGGCVLLGVLGLGGLIGKLTSSPSEAPATSGGLPVVSLNQQMQQAAIEAMHTQQQMMLDLRRQMAEAEMGYYEDSRMAEFGDYEDGNY